MYQTFTRNVILSNRHINVRVSKNHNWMKHQIKNSHCWQWPSKKSFPPMVFSILLHSLQDMMYLFCIMMNG